MLRAHQPNRAFSLKITPSSGHKGRYGRYDRITDGSPTTILSLCLSSSVVCMPPALPGKAVHRMGESRISRFSSVDSIVGRDKLEEERGTHGKRWDTTVFLSISDKGCPSQLCSNSPQSSKHSPGEVLGGPLVLCFDQSNVQREAQVKLLFLDKDSTMGPRCFPEEIGSTSG